MPFEVIVVDNLSSDGTADLLRLRPEPLIIIEPGENLGFGRANNIAAARAKGRYLLLLNPDAYFTDPSALAAMISELRAGAQQNVGAVAPRLNNKDGSHQIGDGGYAPTIGNVVRSFSLISRVIPFAPGFYINNPVLMKKERLRVDWLAATCLLLTREAFEAAEGFDSRFFMYGEDVDLGIRLGNLGYKQFLLPRISVLHLQGATQKSDPDEMHVSFGWIDAIFALHRGEDLRGDFSRHSIAATMLIGFSCRAALNFMQGKKGRKRSKVMLRFALYGWASRLRVPRPKPKSRFRST